MHVDLVRCTQTVKHITLSIFDEDTTMLTRSERGAARATALELGESTYYTGPCTHGHDSPRLTRNGTCVECLRLRGLTHGAHADVNLAKYGIDSTIFNRMLESQNGKCAICGDKLKLGGKSNTSCVVDHCHETGNVRGLLCTRCNKGIGFFEDDIARLERAIRYITQTK